MSVSKYETHFNDVGSDAAEVETPPGPILDFAFSGWALTSHKPGATNRLSQRVRFIDDDVDDNGNDDDEVDDNDNDDDDDDDNAPECFHTSCSSHCSHHHHPL